MTPAPVTTLYAALCGLIFTVLSVRVIARRRASGVTLGTGGRPDLQRAARAHANFAEYVPLGLILLLLAEWAGFPRWGLHVAGAAFVAGRLSHAVGLSQADEDTRLRVIGMAGTLVPIGGLAVALIVSRLASWP